MFGRLAVPLLVALLLAGCGGSGDSTTSTTTGAPTTAPGTTPITTTRTTTSAQGKARDSGPAGGPVPAGFRPQSATFASPARGWVLGTAPCAQPPCTSIVRTEDGGATWQGIPAPRDRLAPARISPGPATIPKGLTVLRFASEREGYAAGARLWSTHDGGASWHLIAGVMSVVSLAAGGGHVLAVTPDGVWSSPTAADNWRRVLSVRDGTEIVTQGDAWWELAVGPQAISVRSAAVTRATPCRYPGAARLAEPDANTLLVACVAGAAAGSDKRTVWRSTNGGRTWSRVGASRVSPDFVDLAVAGDVMLQANASGATSIEASSDGGATWRTALELSDGGLGWDDFGLTSASQGFAVEGGSAMWMTRDGGRRWSRVRF
jgi:photosystem II stability/assembly factor-like uncharacterized protein